jgi:phosphopantothenoylcysteine decarboxylase / phosphopantothenate---cysteine ligase
MTAVFEGRNIVLGVCGGVAAYKSVELCRRLREAGANVFPILTRNALRFVGAETFTALANEAPVIDLWESPQPSPHTRLGQLADLIIVAPATARAVGAYANGLSSDVLTTTLLASRAPVVICPAMHTEMWEHPAVVANMATLAERKTTVVEPEYGALAGGDVGQGRLASTETIMGAAARVLTSHGAPASDDLLGRVLIVSAGGTREPIDSVRFIANKSSGKQGHAIAAAAARRGAKVILVTTQPGNAPVHPNIEPVFVDTAAEMHAAITKRFSSCDALVMAAAVADFRPAVQSTEKIKKSHGVPQIVLEPTIDILASLDRNGADGPVVVGFAAETSQIESYARAKLEDKKLDLIVANDVSSPVSGFDSDENSVHMIGADGWESTIERTSKHTVAEKLLDRVTEILKDKN